MNHSVVPNIPGIPVADDRFLRNKVAQLLQMRSYRFPGAQPVSFSAEQLDELEKEDYFVAEKSDGVRCLALITEDKYQNNNVYLFDRKSNFYVVDNIKFPIPQDPSFRKCHTDTIIDGEIVLDTEPDGSTQLRFLLFDCLVIQRKLLIHRDLMKRLGYLKKDIIDPHRAMLKEYPYMCKHMPFAIAFKEQQYTYHLDNVFKYIIPSLKHGNDGLIFTSVKAPYVLGTCEKMIKWKPANENSIDFKVRLKFPGMKMIPGAEDTREKPRIDLLVWQGNDRYEDFAELGITDEEWKKMFGNSPKKLHNRIIECNFDREAEERLNLRSPWRFMRFRDDKPDGNHQSTVDKVLNSIRDAVSQEELIARIPAIRQAWEARKEKEKERKARQLNL